MNIVPAITFGIFMSLLLAAPPSFSEDTSGTPQRVSEQSALSAGYDRSADRPADPSRSEVKLPVEGPERRGESGAGQVDLFDKFSDATMSYSGSVFTGILVSGLLLLAAMNGRKRPLRLTRNLHYVIHR